MKRSRSRMSWFLRMVVSAVLATSAVVVPAGIANAADTATPELISFSLSATQVTPGQKVTFSYVAAEGAGALGRLRLGYSSGTLNFAGPLPLTGSVTITVPDTWRNGLQPLSWIALDDPSGNIVAYYRNGGAMVGPAGATGPSSHTLPIATGDLTLSGSTVDTTAATLRSLSTSGSPASPGATVAIHYEAADASGSLGSILLTFRDAFQIERVITAPKTLPLALVGTVEEVIPTSWPDGEYSLSSIALTDAHNNYAAFYSDGRVVLGRNGEEGPTSHSVDFTPATFTVSGSTADFTPPRLTSLELLTGPLLRSGETATLAYRAESLDPLTSISFTYANRLSPGLRLVFGGPTAELSGTQAVRFPAGTDAGQYDLTKISLSDSSGNVITYLPDGTTSRSPGILAGKHSIDMHALDLLFGARPGAPKMLGSNVRSASAFIYWDDESYASSFTITAQPGGKTFTTARKAVSPSPGNVMMWTEVTGLTNNTRYRFTVTATNVFGTSPASAASNAVTPRMSTRLLAGKDFTGDGHSDLFGLRSSLTPSEIPMQYLFRGNGLGGFLSGGQRTTDLWSGYPTAFPTADVNGDAVPDVLAVDQLRTLYVFQGNGRGGFFNIHGIGRGWGRFLEVFASDDFSGDRKADVLAVSSDGGLYLYRGNGSSGFAGAGQRIGNGWAGFLAVFSPGDFTGDGRKDLLAVSKDGGLYLYRGNGLGGFIGGGQRLGNGWGSFQSVFSPGDFTGDRRADVMAVTAAGDLILYRGNGRGGLNSGSKKIGSGWNAYR